MICGEKLTPRKWLKRSLLADFGLQPKGYLENTEIRYDISDWEKCIDDIVLSLDDPYNFNSACMLISQKETQNSPQLMIRSKQEADKQKKELAEKDLSKYQEIWHTRNKAANNVWGRAAYRLDDMLNPGERETPITVELIEAAPGGKAWREINKAQETSGAYVRMEKKNAIRPFEVVDTIINDPAGQLAVDSARPIGIELTHYQKKIEQ